MPEKDNSIIHEITPLSQRDCFYIVERFKSEFTYPIHCHQEFELNFIEKASGVRRIVGDSVEVIDDYDLVLITGDQLEHVWEQHECRSMDMRDITIHFFSEWVLNNFLAKNQFDSIRRMFIKAQKGLVFPRRAILRNYTVLEELVREKQGFYSVIKFLSLLYELSLYDDARVLSSRSEERRVGKECRR